LRYSHAPPNRKWLLSKIDQYDADLSTIIRVDRSWTIENSHSIVQGKSRAGTDLRLKTLGQLNRQPGRDQCPLAGTEEDLGVDRQCGHKVHPGRIFTPIGRQLQALGMGHLVVNNRNH